MAKRPATSTEAKVEAFAEDLGRLLGTARAKADSWLSQRQAIAKELEQIRDAATKLLTDLGHTAERQVGRWVIRRARRKMSAKARALISAAQRARWAKVK